MKVGDLVRLTGSKIMRMGIVINIEFADDIFDNCITTPWDRYLILWPNGYMYWDYDIDLELETI